MVPPLTPARRSIALGLLMDSLRVHHFSPMVEEKRAGFKKKTGSLDALLGVPPQSDSKSETRDEFEGLNLLISFKEI